ncbi:MAG TPA: IS1595 family transposase [Tepidisphaeraceae bacterium]|nr:IS1595 family transposase [Tepidisphaeraceae bacterium]
MATKGAQQRTQKGQDVCSFTEAQARDYFESRRWPHGPVCPHCGGVKVTRLPATGKARPGTIQCNDCRQQFTVTVGTVMEDTHLPLAKWAMAFHLMCSSKKGVSALQLQRNLGLGSYRTAWHLSHRIREAMRCEPAASKLKGQVQADETYVGGKPRYRNADPKRTGRGTTKTPVFLVVETDGNAHARPVDRVDAKTLRAAMQEAVCPTSQIVTDDFPTYPTATKGFAGHATVTHSTGEYVGPGGIHTNTAESYFALLKRGVHGTFHHVSKRHLSRYCDEFSFRWNGRKVSDVERRDLAVAGADGKRLMYRQPAN